MTRVVVATRSAHKLREIREILGDLPGYELLDLSQAGIPETPEEEGIEIFETFAENALAKARYFAARTGSVVLADDSGLCVDALGGAPGVRSKRFSGQSHLSGDELDRANCEHLLRSLREVPEPERTGHYMCAAALIAPGGGEAVFLGSCDGCILLEPRGTGGFGYDPLFYIPAEQATFGELPASRKHEISHRARAMTQVADVLRGRAGADPDPADTRRGRG
jgi:XTP/dITP diphosphohydrolase